MLKLLAFDTTTEACSVALLQDDHITEYFILASNKHTEIILPMIKNLLANHQLTLDDLTAIAFTRGPGSFTGLRVGAGIAQGLAFAANKPVVPVSTLATLAYQAHSQYQADFIIPAIDARMNEIYCAAYHIENDKIESLMPEMLCSPSALTIPATNQASKPWFAIGSAWDNYAEKLQPIASHHIQFTIANAYPKACYVAMLGKKQWLNNEHCSAEQALPIYLRDKVTHN